MSLLIFGGKGWIGGQFIEEWKKTHEEGSVIVSNNRTDNLEAVEREIDSVKPAAVVCMVGRTHGPGCNTIDWLEEGRDRLAINIKDNLFSPVSLALLCQKKGVHLTYLGTGCIFSGYDQQYTEDSLPDFFGSGYSVVKGFTDRLMHQLDVLNLRIRMPIVKKDHKRDFITKICTYEKIINRQNSMTVLHDHLPLFVKMIDDRVTGTYNCTNPGSISHVEILDMYQEVVNPEFKYQVMTVEEQDRLLKSERSNNVLNASLINSMHQKYFGKPFPTIHDSIRNGVLPHRENKKFVQ